MQLTTKQEGSERTLFFEGDLQVGVIVEQMKPKRTNRKVEPGCYQWLTKHDGGHAGFYEDAEDEMREAIDR